MSHADGQSQPDFLTCGCCHQRWLIQQRGWIAAVGTATPLHLSPTFIWVKEVCFFLMERQKTQLARMDVLLCMKPVFWGRSRPTSAVSCSPTQAFQQSFACFFILSQERSAVRLHHANTLSTATPPLCCHTDAHFLFSFPCLKEHPNSRPTMGYQTGRKRGASPIGEETGCSSACFLAPSTLGQHREGPIS